MNRASADDSADRSQALDDDGLIKMLEAENKVEFNKCIERCLGSFDIFSDYASMRFWERPKDVNLLFHTEVCNAPASLCVERDALTGDMKNFAETIIDVTSGQSLLLTREPCGPDTDVMGNSSPFLPGGMEDSVAELLKSVQLEAHADVDFDQNLLTTPPGFKEGLDFSSAIAPSETADSLNERLQHLQLSHEVQSLSLDALMDLLETLPSTSELGPQEKTSTLAQSSVEPSADKSDVLDQILPKPVSVRIDIGPSKGDRRTMEKLEWAERLDVSRPLTDFHERVPNMAYTYPFELDVFQKQAISHVDKGDSVFVAAHTSAGKTVVAEYAIALCRKHGSRVIYTSPIKALSNQKYRDFRLTFDDVGLITGDVQQRPEAFCLIMTTEILRLMLYKGAELIRDLEWVIFDEVHYINDSERGVVWEEVLIMLPSHVNLVLLSATVPNVMEFADWVGRIKKRKIYVVSTAKRPVPLEHYLYTGHDARTKDERFMVVDWNGAFLKFGYNNAVDAKKEKEKVPLPQKPGLQQQLKPGQKPNAKAPQHNHHQDKFKKAQFADPKRNFAQSYHKNDKHILLNLIDHLNSRKELPVIIFTFSRRLCDENAGLLRSLDLNSTTEKSEVKKFFHHCVQRLKGTDKKLPQVHVMQEMCERGLGVHHSGILPILKEVVEILFQKGLIRVLFATETFAIGVNMPARTVVFASMQKHDGQGKRDLLPSEYIQMAGRAGRRGLDATGTVILLCKENVPELANLHKMMTGVPTKLESQFRVTYSMLLNLLLVEQLRVEDMLQRSFAECHSLRAAMKRKEDIKALRSELDALKKKPLTCSREVCSVRAEQIEQCYWMCKEYFTLREQAFSELFSAAHLIRLWSPGRIVLFSTQWSSYANMPAILLSVRRTKNGMTMLVPEIDVLICQEKPERCTPQQNEAGSAKVTAMLLSSDDVCSVPSCSRTDDDSGPDSSVILTIKPSDLIAVTTSCVKLNADDVYEDFERRKQPRYKFSSASGCVVGPLDELRKLSSKWPTLSDVPSLHEASGKDAFLLDVDTKAKFLALREKLSKLRDVTSTFKCEFVKQHLEFVMERIAKQEKFNELSFALSESALILMPDYHQKLGVLKHLGYVDENNLITLKGKVAREIHHQELFVTELILDGYFTTDATPSEIAAMLSCATCQEKHSEGTLINEKLKQLQAKIRLVCAKIAKVQEHFQISDYDIEREIRFDLMGVVYEWANGMPFYQIAEMTTSQEGIIVRCIQRLDELCKDVKNAGRVVANPTLQQKMEETSQKIKRDIVFATSLYLET